MRGPKASVRSQGGDIRQWMGSGDGSSGGAASSSSAAPALRQVDLTQLAGVVAWDGASSLLEGIPPTLYLGEREVTQLKERLLDASARESPDDHLVLLRRLSTMVTSALPAPPPRRCGPLLLCVLSAPRRPPTVSRARVHSCPPRRQPCTRPLLEATQIGVTVAKLKKSTDPQACRPCRTCTPAHLRTCAPAHVCVAPTLRCWGPPEHTGCTPMWPSGGGAGVPYRACVERAAGRDSRPDGWPQAALARRRRLSPPPVRPHEIAAAAGYGRRVVCSEKHPPVSRNLASAAIRSA